MNNGTWSSLLVEARSSSWPLSEWQAEAGYLASVRYQQMASHEPDEMQLAQRTGTPRNLVCITKSPADGEADRPIRPLLWV